MLFVKNEGQGSLLRSKATIIKKTHLYFYCCLPAARFRQSHDSTKPEWKVLLLLEKLNNFSVFALRFLAFYYAAETFSVLGQYIPAFNCERAYNFDKLPGMRVDIF